MKLPKRVVLKTLEVDAGSWKESPINLQRSVMVTISWTRGQRISVRRYIGSGGSQISDLTQIRAQTATTARSMASKGPSNHLALASVPEKPRLLGFLTDPENELH
ncbi:hypothetical protein F2Q69_00010244 [Brassica cretica]|uniref:Uncharacterized protein n=1 Tax=Brassica cretica TaxID=69181 RepID=A0A8S9R157_BRACR|nr:hypothetical protein F2Q69_00010244 [Brassica cretica]